MSRLSKQLRHPFQDGDTVVAAVSGGADSMALLHMLCRLDISLTLAVCHVNHGIRGQESDRDCAFVRQKCLKWGIPCYVREADVSSYAAERKISVEEGGREVRYAFFEETAQKLERDASGKVYIATAHTMSDTAETVLLNWARGTGLRGLGGIPFRRGRIVRPMLDMTREQVEEYCRAEQVEFVTDSTNTDLEYSRNRIRKNVLPELRRVNPSLEQTIARSGDILRAEDDFMQETAQLAYRRALYHEKLGIAELKKEHPAIRRRVLALYLKGQGLPVSAGLVYRGEGLLSRTGKYAVGRDRYLVSDGELLACIRQEKAAPYYERFLNNGNFQSDSGVFYKVQTLETVTSLLFHKIYKNLFAISIDCGKIFGSVVIRQRKPGDKIKLHTKAHTKSLKNLFQEAHVSPAMRTKLFVLADDAGVLAVEGFGVAQRAVCDDTTEKRIEIYAVKGTLAL